MSETLSNMLNSLLYVLALVYRIFYILCNKVNFTCRDFEISLEEMGWPMRTIQSNPTPEQINKFRHCAASIIRLSTVISNPNSSKDNKKSTILADFEDPILPILVIYSAMYYLLLITYFTSHRLW